MSSIKTSITEMFKIGPGPSSSHTLGPMRAGLHFRSFISKLPETILSTVTNIQVELYGSLSLTGRGHRTDRAIIAGLLGEKPEICEPDLLSGLLTNENDLYIIQFNNTKIPISRKNIIFSKENDSLEYQNTMHLCLMSNDRKIIERIYYSVGGGSIEIKDEKEKHTNKDVIFNYSNMEELKTNIKINDLELSEIILANEEKLTGKTRNEIF